MKRYTKVLFSAVVACCMGSGLLWAMEEKDEESFSIDKIADLFFRSILPSEDFNGVINLEEFFLNKVKRFAQDQVKHEQNKYYDKVKSNFNKYYKNHTAQIFSLEQLRNFEKKLADVEKSRLGVLIYDPINKNKTDFMALIANKDNASACFMTPVMENMQTLGLKGIDIVRKEEKISNTPLFFKTKVEKGFFLQGERIAMATMPATFYRKYIMQPVKVGHSFLDESREFIIGPIKYMEKRHSDLCNLGLTKIGFVNTQAFVEPTGQLYECKKLQDMHPISLVFTHIPFATKDEKRVDTYISPLSKSKDFGFTLYSQYKFMGNQGFVRAILAGAYEGALLMALLPRKSVSDLNAQNRVFLPILSGFYKYRLDDTLFALARCISLIAYSGIRATVVYRPSFANQRARGVRSAKHDQAFLIDLARVMVEVKRRSILAKNVNDRDSIEKEFSEYNHAKDNKLLQLIKNYCESVYQDVVPKEASGYAETLQELFDQISDGTRMSFINKEKRKLQAAASRAIGQERKETVVRDQFRRYDTEQEEEDNRNGDTQEWPIQKAAEQDGDGQGRFSDRQEKGDSDLGRDVVGRYQTEDGDDEEEGFWNTWTGTIVDWVIVKPVKIVFEIVAAPFRAIKWAFGYGYW